VVEEDSLENYCAGNGTVGSNPTLSAILIKYVISIATKGFGKLTWFSEARQK
jgi:hypothetical protein